MLNRVETDTVTILFHFAKREDITIERDGWEMRAIEVAGRYFFHPNSQGEEHARSRIREAQDAFIQSGTLVKWVHDAYNCANRNV